MHGLAQLIRTEARLLLRDPVSAFFSLAFPPLLLLALGFIPYMRQVQPDLGGLRVIDLYMPITVAVAFATVTLTVLPVYLTTYRERGVLRRLETTPVKPVTLLAAQLAVYLSATLVAITLVLVLGSVVHDVAVPGNLAAFTLALVLTGLALVAVGLLLAAVAPSIGSATGFGQLLYFPMLFFAGVWLPREAMPDALQRLGDFTPSGAGVAALQDAATGGWPAPLHLLVLAATAGGAGLLAARWFRWA